MPKCCCSTTTTKSFETPDRGFAQVSAGGDRNPVYAACVKLNWIHLPLALLISACQPIVRGPGADGGPKRILQAGHFARTIIDNTSFFRQLPLSGGEADLLLQRHTSLRVIKLDPGYSKVELDSGEIGFVKTASLEPIALSKPVERPNATEVENREPDVLDPSSPIGPGMPELLPPAIEPE